ncbi:unnamed protein product [Tuber melanosporum]|uniref:Type 1 phosphatases regulator n=1 Tax=Tuber melanosporum (strain Mel28) TaxID=656061 RepID=D5G906_TUBMM|nr:uncharacterized protein GSTUM_00004926001 [Tuber melanosporum]KAG0136582.1 phosphatase inhibitor-domain-containing protein [Tuber indicum]CAZ80999.1 unnamed protein product [Tuber melanosporum]
MLLPPPDRRELAPALPSATQTETDPSVQTSIRSVRIPDGTLRLRGGPVENRRVRWDAGVIDNEGMGKKKSKVCCIYSRPRAYDESSSDESDSSSDEDSENEGHGHTHNKNCGHGPKRSAKGKSRDSKRAPNPNAYEKMPKPARKKSAN